MTMFAWAFSLPVAILDILLVQNGIGKDIWQVPNANVTQMYRLFYIAELFYGIGTGFVKVALLAFYMRLFPQTTVHTVSRGLIVFTTLLTTAIFFAVVFQCTPVNYAWLQWSGQSKGQCRSFWVLAYIHGAMTILLDLIILLLPMPTVYKLRIKWQRKLQVGGEFPAQKLGCNRNPSVLTECSDVQCGYYRRGR